MATQVAAQAMGPATELLKNYFFMRHMEKVEDVVKGLVDDVYKKSLSGIAAGSGAVSLQQMNLLKSAQALTVVQLITLQQRRKLKTLKKMIMFYRLMKALGN